MGETAGQSGETAQSRADVPTSARGTFQTARTRRPWDRRLRIGDREVSGVFEFGPDGLPLRIRAERFTDQGELRPWGGVYRDFRTVSGMRVPFEADVAWELETGPYLYARWRIDEMAYDEEPPADAR